MKIWLITITYPPEIGGAAQWISELAASLQAFGHEVTVLTGFPRYNLATIPPEYRSGWRMTEHPGGVPVRRVRIPALARGSKIARGLEHFAFGAWLSAAALAAPRADVALVFSPPLPLPWLTCWVGRLRRVPVVVNIQDLFPREAVELGMLTSRPLIRVFEHIERQVHRMAAAITVHSPGNRAHVIAQGGAPERTRVIYNYVDTNRIQPGRRQNEFARQHGLHDHFVVSYAGTMGWAQDMTTIVDAAACLRRRPAIRFLLVGDGVEKQKAHDKCDELGLTNIVWLPMQPADVYPHILAASDVSMINLNPELRTPVVPSKLLSIMAAGRPVVASLPAESDARSIVDDARCGLCVPAGDGPALAPRHRAARGRPRDGRRHGGERAGLCGNALCAADHHRPDRGAAGAGSARRSDQSRTGAQRRNRMTDHLAAYSDQVVLVTGGAGAIGSNLARALAEAGARVIILDDLSSSERWNVPSLPGVMFVEGDILDEVKLKRVFFERPRIVYHLAAFFANQNSIDHPERDLAVNGMGTLRLLEYATLAGVDRFVYASSGCSIYGKGAPLPLREEFMSMHLSTPYQVTKMLGELYCNFFCDHFGVPVVKPRFFNSYGPGEVPGQYRNVIPNFIYWAMRGQPLPITGSGEETRDFTFVGDIVDGLLRAGVLPSAVGQEFNLASGVETRIVDLAQKINEATGNKAGIRFAQKRKWDTKSRLLASVDRAHDLIGYNPSTAFDQGLAATIRWFHDNWERIDAGARFGPGVSSAVREMTAAVR